MASSDGMAGASAFSRYVVEPASVATCAVLADAASRFAAVVVDLGVNSFDRCTDVVEPSAFQVEPDISVEPTRGPMSPLADGFSVGRPFLVQDF